MSFSVKIRESVKTHHYEAHVLQRQGAAIHAKEAGPLKKPVFEQAGCGASCDKHPILFKFPALRGIPPQISSYTPNSEDAAQRALQPELTPSPSPEASLQLQQAMQPSTAPTPNPLG